MEKVISIILIIVGLYGISVKANSPDSEVYVVAGINSIKYDSDVRELNSAQGWEIGLGNQLTENWAIEFRYSDNNVDEGFGIHSEYLQLNTIYSVNDNEEDSLFVKMGLGSFVNGESNLSTRLGLGYEFTTGSNTSFYVGLDSQYQFNNSALEWVPYLGIKVSF